MKTCKSPVFIFFFRIIGLLIMVNRLNAANDPDSLVNHAVNLSLVHLQNSLSEVNDTTLYPTYGTKYLIWQLKSSKDWTAGFYPGCLWYVYELCGDEKFKDAAISWTSAIEDEKFNSETHDLGFRFMCSFGKGLQFLNDDNNSTYYKNIILTAAETLSKRYNPTIGLLSSNWDMVKIENSFPVVIDIMSNLEILFWAAQNGGNPELASIARTHSLNTIRDFVRPDGGTYHIVRYNQSTGEIINKGTLQGAGDETTWSRGQAWIIYGLAVTYRYTHEKNFLDAALRLTDYFLNHLENDYVSLWDFQSDISFRDVSATSIVTSALLELSGYIEDDSLKVHYTNAAASMLSALCREPYFINDLSKSCILDHSVQYLPINSNVDVPAIFADYYFLEALVRYRNLE